MINLYGKISRVEKNGKGVAFTVAGQSVVMKKSVVKADVYAKIEEGLRVIATAEADVVTEKKEEHVVWFVQSFVIDPIQEFKEKR